MFFVVTLKNKWTIVNQLYFNTKKERKESEKKGPIRRVRIFKVFSVYVVKNICVLLKKGTGEIN